MKYIILTSILLFNQISFAACNKPVTYLTEGSTTQCNGYLFTPEKEKEVREVKSKYETLEALSAKQDELNKNLLQQVEVKTKQVEYMNKYVDSVKSDDTFEQIIYFSLGIALGLGISKAFK